MEGNKMNKMFESNRTSKLEVTRLTKFSAMNLLKHASVILILLLSIVLTTNYVKAQDTPPPCVPDCENTPFHPVEQNDFYFDNGCIIRVWYTWRKACDVYYDIQIVKIETLNPLCNDYSYKQIFDSAFKKVIELNKMGFPPKRGECDVNWRISAASCWSFWNIIVTGDPHMIMLPCAGSGCCYQPYQVCRDQQGNITLTPLGSPWPAVNCDTATPPSYPPGLTCNPICDWLIMEQYNPGSLIEPNKKDNQDMGNAIKIEIPSNGETLNMLVSTDKKSNFSIKITDVYGIQLIEQNGVVENSITPITVKTSELHNGNYLYNIYIDGVLLYSGKLLIIK